MCRNDFLSPFHSSVRDDARILVLVQFLARRLQAMPVKRLSNLNAVAKHARSMTHLDYAGLQDFDFVYDYFFC